MRTVCHVASRIARSPGGTEYETDALPSEAQRMRFRSSNRLRVPIGYSPDDTVAGASHVPKVLSLDAEAAGTETMTPKRFTLARDWLPGANPLLWIDFNPGPADDVLDDPQTVRMMDMSMAWGYTGLRIVSLFPDRGTVPSFGRNQVNELALWAAFALHSEAVACWGNAAPTPWALYIRHCAADAGCTLWCLGLTDRGAPKHPLPLAVGTPRVPYEL